MRLQPGCPRCPARVTVTGERVLCPTHGEVVPLWCAAEPEYDAFAEYLVRAGELPTWLPWPMPPGWQVTDFGCVGFEGSPARGTVVTCAGPSELDGMVELTVVSEEPGVGLGARCAAATYTDPGRDAGAGAPLARIQVDDATVPMWAVSSGEGAEVFERAVFAGEARGRWIWLVLRPASAALLLQELSGLRDVSALGPELVTLPFGQVPRGW